MKNLSTNNPMVGIFCADIILGSPKRDCRHLGICRVDPAESRSGDQASSRCQPSVQAYLSLDHHGRLFCSFNSLDLTTEQYAKHFGAGNFVVEDILELPPLVCHRLGTRQSLIISVGTFPVIEHRGRLLVSLKVHRVERTTG